MLLNKSLSDLMIRFESISVFVTDDHFHLQTINNTALESFSESQIEEIVSVFRRSSNYFCVLLYQCEVEVLKQEHSYIFLVHSKKDLCKLYRELEQAEIEQYEFNEIMNASFDGIVIADATGTILFQNKAYEQFTGKPREFFIGKRVQDFEDKLIDNSLTPLIVKEEKPLSIIQTFFSTGKKALISGVPIRNKKGEIYKVVANTRDLTTLNNLEKEIQELKRKNAIIKNEKERAKHGSNPTDTLVAQDQKMKEVIERALRVAQVDSTVLIQGESGAGKEGIVKLIHQSSNRKNKPLIQINCGAIPEQLLESELFGYESGAFTGASNKGKPGLFESANGGTIFLDEIGEMPLYLQVKLLRVLQEFEITRIGGVKPIKVNVRVITATNRNLEEMVSLGTFREDLYYRLKIIPIFIPPLRDRKDDIIPLIYHFLFQIKNKYGIERVFSQEALENFHQYHWPGNVRELQNMVERFSLMVNKSVIDITDIKNEMESFDNIELQKTTERVKEELIEDDLNERIEIRPLKEKLEEYEKMIIQQALGEFSSIRKAAKALKVDQSTLVRKKQKYSL